MCPNPVKPTEPENPERRKFLARVIFFLGGIIAVVLGGSGSVYFLSPAWKGKKEGWVDVCQEEGLPEGQPVKKEFVQRTMDGWETVESRGSVWLLRERGKLTAYNPHCTHLGCPYRWDETKGQFLCPCHNGVFSKDGQVVSGPPPRSLDRFSVKTENGVVSILPGEDKA